MKAIMKTKSSTDSSQASCLCAGQGIIGTRSRRRWGRRGFLLYLELSSSLWWHLPAFLHAPHNHPHLPSKSFISAHVIEHENNFTELTLNPSPQTSLPVCSHLTEANKPFSWINTCFRVLMGDIILGEWNGDHNHTLRREHNEPSGRTGIISGIPLEFSIVIRNRIQLLGCTGGRTTVETGSWPMTWIKAWGGGASAIS